MQDYLQRTRLAGRMDEAGSTLALLTGSVVFFLLFHITPKYKLAFRINCYLLVKGLSR